MLIDNLSSNFKLQPNNGLQIKDWTDDIWDKQLLYLAKILKKFVVDKVEDVRVEIKKIKDSFGKPKRGKINSLYHSILSTSEHNYQDIYLSLLN